VLGRSLSPDEALQGSRPVLIGDRFWQERFGRSADALGATLVLNGVPSEIIGVVPEGFRPAVDVWQPLRIAAQDASLPGGEDWFVLGRLRPGVTVDRAQAEMTTVARRLNDGLAPEVRRAISVVPLRVSLVGAERLVALWLLGGAVFCVLLIAAANVTSLSLARGFGRAREMAVRAALGASVPRIVRQVLVEGIVLAAVSGLIGTLLAAGAIHGVRTFGPGTLPRLSEMSLDLRVLAWTAAISLLTGLVVGLAPAIMITRPKHRISTGEGGRSVSSGAASRRIRRTLVVAECALAIVLLVGAGLLIRSWRNVTSTDPGFRPERVLVLGVSSPASFTAAARADLYTRMLERIHAVPGVESAGMIGDLINGGRARVITTEGAPPSEHALVLGLDEASPEAFRALGTPLLRGRFFSAGDGPGAPRVAIINEAMARRLWPGRDPVGARLKVGAQNADGPWFTVVGVVGDMQRQGPEREPIPQMFQALAQTAAGSGMDVIVRTSIDPPLALAGAVRAAVHAVEPLAPVYGATSLNEMLGGFLAQRRFETWLLGGFALAALLMAAVGLYGILQYSMATRTREIGLRLAIGAQPGDIFRMLVGEGLRLSGMGLALGLAGALAAGPMASRLLFGVTPLDPWTFTGVVLLMTAVALLACLLPARRAMRIEPTSALREG
jgi:putative ABC transport system permease protein